MLRKLLILIIFFGFLPIGEVLAAPILLTLAETDQGVTSTWWPSQFGQDTRWIEAFSRQGIEVISPRELTSKPKISPVVYPSQALSSANARMLGSLFSTDNVLNGTIQWQCEPLTESTKSTKVECAVQVNVNLLYNNAQEMAFPLTIQTSASSANLAQEAAIAQIASRLALPILRMTASRTDIPALTNKPVIVLQNLSSADMLIAIRKRLKTISGVEDISERWGSEGSVSLEINPDSPQMDAAKFSEIIQLFMQENENVFHIRELSRSEAGVVFELLSE